MFDRAEGGAYGWADCRDTSCLLLLGTSSIGYTGTLTQGYSPGTDANGHAIKLSFDTNDIQSIGRSGYGSAVWGFHQFFEDSGNVFDACAAQAKDLSGSSYNEVPFAWLRADYWQKANPNSLGNFFGLVKGFDGGPACAVPGTFIPALVRGPINPDPYTDLALLQGVK
jgi:hypothetical protein